jgi:hypothetical protein
MPRARAVASGHSSNLQLPTLMAGRDHPEQFAPSLRFLRGNERPLPAGVRPVEAASKLLPGTPLLCDSNGWIEVLLASVGPGSEIKVRFPLNAEKGIFVDKQFSRQQVAISEETLAALDKPDAAELFAKRLIVPDRIELGAPLPDRFARVTTETPLRNGVQVRYVKDSNWVDAKVKN